MVPLVTEIFKIIYFFNYIWLTLKSNLWPGGFTNFKGPQKLNIYYNIPSYIQNSVQQIRGAFHLVNIKLLHLILNLHYSVLQSLKSIMLYICTLIGKWVDLRSISPSCSTHIIIEHQNSQAQEQFLPSGNPSHEHLIINVEQMILLYMYFNTHTYLHFKLAPNSPVGLHTKMPILYIVFLLFCTLSILYICILLFLLSVSCLSVAL